MATGEIVKSPLMALRVTSPVPRRAVKGFFYSLNQKSMDLRDGQKLIIAGEIVVDTTIIVDIQGVIENKDALKKCPHCHTGVGKNFFRSTGEESGETEMRFACESCTKQWSLRFRNPFLFIQI